MERKILYVVTKSNFGGAQRYVLDLASNPPLGFESVVAAGGHGILFEKCVAAQIRCATVPGLTRDVGLFSELQALISLGKLYRRESPQIVHLNSSKAGALGALLARIFRIPHIVFTIHGLPHDEPRSYLSKKLILAITWVTCLCAHSVICISHNNYARVRAWSGMHKKTQHIYNGVVPFSTLSKADARAALSLEENGFVIGCIAELHKNKGISFLIEALAALPTATLVCIGDGDERTHLQILAEQHHVNNRVRFIGYKDNAREYLRAFDVLCLPSIKEGLPYVLLEAQYVGIPIVATSLPGIREILGENAHTVPSEDVAALVSALQNPQTTPLASDFSFEKMKAATHALYGIRQGQ